MGIAVSEVAWGSWFLISRWASARGVRANNAVNRMKGNALYRVNGHFMANLPT